MKKRVLIVDDEPLARSIIQSYLKDNPHFEVVGECGNGFEAIKAIPTLLPDLLFLDIQMPKVNGFELLEILSDPPAVIFTTAFDEYALKAFEVNAIDYLLKPFSSHRFNNALEKFLARTNNNESSPESDLASLVSIEYPEEQQRIVIKDGSEIKIIPINTVHYIEAYDDYVKIMTSEGKFLKKKTLAHYENVLKSKQFVRIHRSFLLNITELTRIESFEKNSYVAILKSGARLAISRSAYSDLKSKLGI